TSTTTPALFVDPLSLGGGDGTEMHPFQRIHEALGAVHGRTIIALSPGRFAEPVVLPGGVLVIGACVSPDGSGASGTVIVRDDDQGAAVEAVAGHAGIKNLAISSAGEGVRAESPDASLSANSVLIARAPRG